MRLTILTIADADDDGGLLKKRKKTEAEKEAEQNEYANFLAERQKVRCILELNNTW